MNRKVFFNQAFFLFIVLVFSGSDGFPTADQVNGYFIAAAKKAKSSVVMITVFNKRGNKLSTLYEKTAYGSGTCILDNSYIVTNYHVLQKGDYYQITHGAIKYSLHSFGNGEQLFLYDVKTDIALLKIDEPPESDLLPITLCDSESIREGEWVIAIGNPFGLNQSITGGIISSKGRDNIGFSDIEDFIQSDVPINPGNSGGPLVNLKGEMVGLNTAIRTDSGGSQGISFSIPSNIVKEVCSDLIAFGRVRRGWIGFIVKERIFDNEERRNCIEVLSVLKHSPADAAGLRKGDIIREIDGTEVTTIGMLLKHVGTKKIGTKVNITISRDGLLKDIRMTLREKQEYKKMKKGLHDLYSKYGIEIDENADTEEVIVTRVSPWSMGYGLKEGDIIVKLNDKKVSTLDEFMKSYLHYRQKISTMRVKRDYHVYHLSNFED